MLILSILLSITPGKAAFASLFIPGSGDLMLGEKKRAAYFLTAEAVTWAYYFGFCWEEGKVGNSSESFAALYASANIQGKGESYFESLENYISSDEYNESIKEEARNLYPDTTAPDILKERRDYIEEHIYTGENAWSWQSTEAAKKYHELRVRKRDFGQKAVNMVGFAVLNRLVNFFVTYLAGERVRVEVKEDEIKLGVRF
ncbi:MAG: hypothetical protein U9N06_07390 [candidate division WOR-3 bacterium]|nr:hypothetical protein [candidate division WOR-3 bacterium]